MTGRSAKASNNCGAHRPTCRTTLRQALLAAKALIEQSRKNERTERPDSARSADARAPQEGRPSPGSDEEFEKFLARKTTIVCVDGDPTALERLRTILSAGGFETVAISNVSTALDQIWECLPHLIIVDPVTCNMRGLELCRQLRAHPETDDIPIVLHTALAVPEEAGLYDCICAKPVESRTLLLLVRTLLMVRP
jgi:PleD family two-component response regulator